MKYRVEIDGQEREFDVLITPGGQVAVSLDGKALDVDARAVPGGVSLVFDGVVYDVMVGGSNEKMSLASGPHRAIASVSSARDGRRKRGGKAKAGAGELRAPMPGRVLSVAVEVGATVVVGDSLVVMEAMKMENELRADAAGEVVEVAVSVGQNVENGALLVRVKPSA